MRKGRKYRPHNRPLCTVSVPIKPLYVPKMHPEFGVQFCLYTIFQKLPLVLEPPPPE